MLTIKTLPQSLPARPPKELHMVYSVCEGGFECHEHRDKEGLGLMCRYWCDSPTAEWMISWSHVALPELVYQGEYNAKPTTIGGQLVSPSQVLYSHVVDAFNLASRAAMQAEIDQYPKVRKVELLTHANGLCALTGNIPTHMVSVATCWRFAADLTVLVHESVGLEDHASLLGKIVAAEL